MHKVTGEVTTAIGEYLDGVGVSAGVDVREVGSNSVAVYITVPIGLRDEVDELAIYEALAGYDTLADVEIDLEIIDMAESNDELEGALADPDADDEQEDEDEYAADNLVVVDAYGRSEVRSKNNRASYDNYDEEEDDEDDDDYYDVEDDDEIVAGIDEYEPSWDELDEIMGEDKDEDY